MGLGEYVDLEAGGGFHATRAPAAAVAARDWACLGLTSGDFVLALGQVSRGSDWGVMRFVGDMELSGSDGAGNTTTSVAVW